MVKFLLVMLMLENDFVNEHIQFIMFNFYNINDNVNINVVVWIHLLCKSVILFWPSIKCVVFITVECFMENLKYLLISKMYCDVLVKLLPFNRTTLLWSLLSTWRNLLMCSLTAIRSFTFSCNALTSDQRLLGILL